VNSWSTGYWTLEYPS